MKRLLMLNFCIVLAITMSNAQTTMISPDKAFPIPIEIRSKGIATPENRRVEEEENPVFPYQAFNRILENQLKFDGLLGQSEKLVKLELTDKVLVINSKEMETKFKDKYLNLYYNFMRKKACQGCPVSYIIE